jgi:hypothetical protein
MFTRFGVGCVAKANCFIISVMLNPGTWQLRNNALPLILNGEIATVA